MSTLIVLRATTEEEAAHDAVLNAIEKERKGITVWRQFLVAPAAQPMAA
jgi:hypothetical protein